MASLNWSLKLHVRLRTISLLISTHITHVYVQWMPYSFVWLYLIKCVFTDSIFVDQTQKDFWVFYLFLESTLFLQKLSKSSKTVLPCFGDSVAGWSSRMPQSRAHTEIFHGSLAGQCPSGKKCLEYFSKFEFLMFLVAQIGNLFAGEVPIMGYSEIFAAYFATLLRVELPVAKNT